MLLLTSFLPPDQRVWYPWCAKVYIIFPFLSPLGIETSVYWEAYSVVKTVILWIRERIFKYSTPTPICQGLNSSGWLLTVLPYVPELKYFQELHSFLSLSLPTIAQPKPLLPCQLDVLWCSDERTSQEREGTPVSLLWAEEHRDRKASTQLLKSKLWWPWQEGTMGQYLLRVPASSLHSHGEASLLLQWPPRVPEKLGRSCFGRLLCQPCFLCLHKAEYWLVWQPPRSIQRCLVGDRLFGEGTVVAVEMETHVLKCVRGQRSHVQSYVYLENLVL